MSKHTPGPWQVMGFGAFPMVYGPKSERVCKTIDNNKDAYLIAAAPDMLEALEALLRTYPTHASTKFLIAIENARNVIDKAKGEK